MQKGMPQATRRKKDVQTCKILHFSSKKNAITVYGSITEVIIRNVGQYLIGKFLIFMASITLKFFRHLTKA